MKENDIKSVNGGVCAAKGYLAAGVYCGIRRNRTKKDLALVYSETPATAAAVYTRNRVKGAPLAVTKAHVDGGNISAIICNSGIANTCCAGGKELAEETCAIVGETLGIPAESVAVASTGVIGQPLDLAPFRYGVPELKAALSRDGSDAALAIMTTDTISKQVAVEFTLGGKVCRLGGMAKGSGMIHPDMATMLVFLTTDAAVSKEMLQRALSGDVADTFNMMSVDGDTSTNDTILGLANGASGVAARDEADLALLEEALTAILGTVSHMLVMDGEGASKVIHISVRGARNDADAELVARSVGHSQLVKTAIYGGDANWGRIVTAVGYSGASFDPAKVGLHLCGVERFRLGRPVNDDQEGTLAELLKARDIAVDINLGDGPGSYSFQASDLGHEYVTLNSDYRS